MRLSVCLFAAIQAIVSFLPSPSDCLGLRRRATCPIYELEVKNGAYQLSAGNMLATFTCNDGFYLFGKTQIVCFSAYWSSPAPICISNTCREVTSTTTLRVSKEYAGSLLRFSCAPLYKLEGATMVTCDGSDWSHKIPQCIDWIPPTSCDFETEDICGWTNQETDEQDWLRNSGATPTKRTGPEHDHTLGASGEGHYMYYETSSPAREGHAAILGSPLYPASFSGRCFSFWYHILGDDNIGQLSVVIASENQTVSEVKPEFSVSASAGPDWLNHSLVIKPVQTPFQIYFFAKRGSGYRSDFAIDDVTLYECPEATTVTTTVGTPTPSESTTKVPTTPQTTRPTQLPTTVIKKQPSSSKTSATSTTTTTTTTIQTTKTTVEITNKKSSSSSSGLKTTAALPSSASTSARPKSTGRNAPITTPLVNPNLDDGENPSPSKELKKPKNGSRKLLYILLGVGAVVMTVIVIAVALFWYRKRKYQVARGSMSTVNPLYTAMDTDENAVNIDSSNRYRSF